MKSTVVPAMLAAAMFCDLAPALAQSSPADDGSDDAEAGLAEIVVTAQKRSENLQDTPIAITALAGEALASVGSNDIVSIAALAPSLTAVPYPGSGDIPFLFIRGQGAADPGLIAKDGAVGMYLDGFYLARPQSSNIDLADIERVEVLRGPQGTLYGRNTTGGAINIITREPSGELALRQRLTIGNRNYVRSQSTLDLPAVGDFAAKLSLLTSHKDGWIKNIGGANDYSQKKQLAGSATLLWTPADTVSIRYMFDKGDVDFTPIFQVNPSLVGILPGYTGERYRTYRPVDLIESETEFEGHSLTAEWDATDNLTIRSLSGYRHINSFTFNDFVEAYGIALSGEGGVDSKQYSQELQLVGTAFDARVDYVLGLYYFRERGRHVTHLDFLGGLLTRDLDSRALTKSKAAYGQVTWTPPILDDRLEVTVGARYTDDSRSASRDRTNLLFLPGSPPIPQLVEVGTRNDQDFSKFNPAITLNFAATDDLNTYVKVTTGYKAGGSNENAADFRITFGPETVTNYEIGLKSDLWDRRLRINLAAFLTDYRDLQIDLSTNAQDPNETQTLNAGSAEIKGFEADITAAPFPDLTLSASYAYLDAKIKRVNALAGTIFDPAVNPTSPYRVGQNVGALFALPFAPKHSVVLSGDWTFLRFAGGDLTASADYRWKDSTFMTVGAGRAVIGRDNNRVPSYGLLDARVTLSNGGEGAGRIALSIWGRNITDKRYPAYVAGLGTILTGFPTQVVSYAEPASYGIELAFNF